MKQSIILSENDNVATVLSDIAQGEKIEVRGIKPAVKVVAIQSIPMGHKVAIENIKKGDNVIKYGNVIGIAIKDIKIGEHVHIHNVASSRTEPNIGGETA